MRVAILILLSFFLTIQVIYAQENQFEISGLVTDTSEHKPLPFATIYKAKTNEATISNENGYFEFNIDSVSDSLTVSYIGYKSKLIPLKENKKFYNVILEKNILELDEVVIQPKDDSYLLGLIEKCRKSRSQEKIKGKAYYQLKSYSDNKQIELVENYYNATVKGYDLLTLNPKAGRVGLRKEGQYFFGSLETSQPIVQHKLFSTVKWFPKSPMHMNLKSIRKRFYIERVKEYVEDKDSIVEVLLYPKKNKAKYFTTTLWMNQTENSFLKIQLSGSNLDRYPLEPLYDGDKLLNKNLKIVKTFKKINGKMCFEHIHFNYNFLYRKKGKSLSKIYTKAIVQVYSHKDQFELPQYGFLNPKMNDYQVPYNHFFWKHNKELKLNDELDTNKLFMLSKQTFTNQSGNNKNDLGDFFNHKTYRWSKQRMRIKKLPQNIDYKEGQEMTSLKNKIFLDLNYFNDSLHVYSVALFDSHESYYHYKIDTMALCFINMYFDLVEISRRNFERTLKGKNLSKDLVYSEYEKSNKRLEERSYLFFEEVEHGTNVLGMRKWNKEIVEKLNVDNLNTYRLYQTDEKGKTN